MMRGMLRWREGNFDESAKGLRRAAELAEQVGRSEVAFQSLYWLAASLRQRGDYADADTELARALDLCERAGLVAQSVEAISARAVNLALAERGEAAREAAEEAERLADRLRYPVGKAASLEARGAVAEDPAEASAALSEARDAWQALGRPLDAARCDYLRGRILRDADPDQAREALESAAEGAERYGVHHLAELARDLPRPEPGTKWIILWHGAARRATTESRSTGRSEAPAPLVVLAPVLHLASIGLRAAGGGSRDGSPRGSLRRPRLRRIDPPGAVRHGDRRVRPRGRDGGRRAARRSWSRWPTRSTARSGSRPADPTWSRDSWCRAATRRVERARGHGRDGLLGVGRGRVPEHGRDRLPRSAAVADHRRKPADERGRDQGAGPAPGRVPAPGRRRKPAAGLGG